MSLFFYVLVMAGVTYLIRMLPMIIFKKKIQNRLIRSFLFYIPYAVLAAMTFPAILDATQSTWSALAALVAAILLAWCGQSLFTVSVLSCVTVFLLELVLV